MRGEMKGFDEGQIDAKPRRRRARRLSEVFSRLSEDANGPISIGYIRDFLGNRSFAALLVLFGAINMIPLPPGASALFGAPLVIVAAQMVYGKKQAWLPKLIRERSLSADQFRRVMEWIIPRLQRLERLIRPRYWPFWRRQGDRVIGLLALIMAITITLPIPLGNWLPAVSTTLLGLALSERDGLLFAIGTFVGVAALALIVFVGAAAGLATQAVWGWIMH
ncbi:MAG: exopolysaccharide biosynthesis protein [Rhizobiaceae bacterium]|nr:exopolysaccharide biosynthesis protein [Rhizobiaceae bacterium]